MNPTFSAVDAAAHHAQAVMAGAGEKRSRDEIGTFGDTTNKRINSGFAPGDGPYDTNQFTIKFLIKRQLGGAIIGRGASNIKALRESHVAKIEVTPGWDGHPDRLVGLTGFKRDVNTAFISILEAIWMPNPNSVQERATVQTLRFLIPNTHMGAVIGKGGSNIMRLREESGAQVKTEKQGGQVDRVVEMTGDKGTLRAACEGLINMIEQELSDKLLPVIPDLRLIQPFHFESELILQQLQQRAYVGAAGGMSVGMSVGVAAPPPANVGEAIKFTVMQEAIGRVIGKGGANIQSMRQQSGAYIHVDSTTKEVTITGTPEAKQIAFILLTQILNSEQNSFSSWKSSNFT